MTPRFVGWNLIRRLRAYCDADILVLSLGKSGRTWLRVLIHKYLSLHYNIPFDLESMHKDGNNIPNILYTHKMGVHYRDNAALERLLGKDILADCLARKKRLVILVRNPGDIVVSSYFHKTKRSKRIDCTLSEFVRHKRFGIDPKVWIMNQWYQRFRDHPACLWVSYEDMRQDTNRELLKVLDFLRIDPDETLVQVAVDFGRFDNMRNMEAAGKFSSGRLRPGDVHDPDSFKVRRGKVHGYLDYLDSHDVAYLDDNIAKLDPFFGYAGDSTCA